MKRLLVAKLADVGDTLTATPALRALRQSFPDSRIDALVTPVGAAVLGRSGLVDTLVVLDKHRYDAPLAALDPGALLEALRLARSLRAGNYDALLLLHHLTTAWGTAKYALLALTSGAKFRAGLDNGRGWFLTHRVADAGFGAHHEVDYWLAVAATLGAEASGPPRLEFATTTEEQDWAQRALGPGRWAALYPGSGSYSLARRWPAACYASVGQGLRTEHGMNVVVVGGSEERDLAAEVAAQVPGALNLASHTSLGQLAALLHRCELLVGNDGGPMHLAVAVGTPVVAVFGPSNHQAWGPYGGPKGEWAQRHRVVRVDLPCSPCLYRGHSLGKRHGCAALDCLRLVTPEMVLSAAEELLSTRLLER